MGVVAGVVIVLIFAAVAMVVATKKKPKDKIEEEGPSGGKCNCYI